MRNYSYREPGLTRNEILEIIRVMPGLSSREVAELMPHVKMSTVQPAIHQLKIEGVIKVVERKTITMKDGKTREVDTYTLNNEPTPNVVKMKRKEPTEAGLHVQIKQLQEQIAELEVWKKEAIARFPDLAVDPVILKARKLVAEEVRAGGDSVLAEAVRAGRKDDTLMMRVTVKALEEGND